MAMSVESGLVFCDLGWADRRQSHQDSLPQYYARHVDWLGAGVVE